MKFIYFRVIPVLIFLVGILNQSQAQACDLSDCPTVPIDLNTWMRMGNPNFGIWSVNEDGSFVSQSQNDDPTFFVSPDDLINTVVEGSFRAIGNDDDFIGFVFGFQGPSETNENYDFLLFDWKANNQSVSGYGVGKEGFSLSRINGNFASITELRNTFWEKRENPALAVLDTDYNTSNGWVRNTLFRLWTIKF